MVLALTMHTYGSKEAAIGPAVIRDNKGHGIRSRDLDGPGFP